MKYVKIDDINKYKSDNVNPLNYLERVFEMYSVPSFEFQYPEIVEGNSIGSSKQKVEEGDILLCKINPRINRVWIVGNNTDNLSIASSEWIVIRNKEHNAKYLAWYFRTKEFKSLMESQVTGIGGSLTRAQPKCVKEYFVPIQERKIQDKIVQILDTAQFLIDKRKEQIEACDELIKSRFVELFGDPLKNQMGWVTGTIRDIVSEVKYGTSNPAVEGGKYTYLRMNNITYGGHLDLSNLKYINMADNEVEKYIVRKGDVLFNRTNSKELVGKTCVFNLDEEMIIAGYIIRIRVNERVVPEYLSEVLNSRYGKETLFGMCKAIVGQANINAQEVQDIKICIPPIELQTVFVEFVQQVDKLKFDFKRSLSEMEDNFDALMQKAFKGELFSE